MLTPGFSRLTWPRYDRNFAAKYDAKIRAGLPVVPIECLFSIPLDDFSGQALASTFNRARLKLQLLIVTPLQKIHVIEPFVSHVGFVANTNGDDSQLRNMTIQEYREEKDRYAR